MNQFKRSIARSSFVLFVATVLSGLLMQVASAAIVAEFTTTWSANSSAEAEATGVSYAGADARGKVFLEEERTNSPHDVLRKLQPPSEADVAKYATSVSSMDQAQAVLTKEVATYDKVVAKAKKKVLKLKLKLKHGESSDKAKLKKKLKKAKKVQNLVKTSWKYKPLLKFERGMSYRNTGRNDRLILESFVDYVDGDKAFVVAGWVPELRDIVIVAVKKTDGTYLAGCNNFVYFNIPPGTLDRSVVVIVRVLAEVELEVSVGVRVAGRLTAHGVMKNNGVVCDEDSTFTDVNEFKALPPVKVRATDAAKAFDIGRNQAQADAKARAEVKKDVKVSIETTLEKKLTLSCEPEKEDTPPEMTCTGMEHIFVGESRSAFDFDASDANGDPITFGNAVVTGPLNVVTVERSNNRLTVWITAQDIPSGTSQAASVTVIATANGKSVSCAVNTTVENNHTGW